MTILNFVILLALLATIVALGAGLWSMMHGGKYDAEHSEKLMFTRIGLQGMTFVLLLIAGYLGYNA